MSKHYKWMPAFLLAAALAAIVAAAPADPKSSEPSMTSGAQAQLHDSHGKTVGEVRLTQATGGVLIHAEFNGLPAGIHAFHIHETGKCEGPDFKSAGGHFNPDGKEHGFLNVSGPHAGDLPNIDVPKGGRLVVEDFDSRVSLEQGKSDSLLKSGGTAFVVHAGKDDYKSNPAGDAGSRIACGVIQAAH